MAAAPNQYEPGACNIGPAEIAYRRRWGDLGLIVSLVLFAVLVWAGAPHWTRIVLALPAAASAVGYLQAYLRFCAAFGALGVFNFGTRRDVRPVSDPQARARDRVRAFEIFAASAVIGLAVGSLAVLLPI